MNTLTDKTDPEVTVLLPKSAFKDDSRNRLSDLMAEAGYYDAASGRMGRSDKVLTATGFYEDDETVDIRQGEICFRFLKGAGALAKELRVLQLTEKPAIAITGGDILLDAYSTVSRQIEGTIGIEKVTDLDIGRCSLEWLSPNENPIDSAEAITGRDLFSKYPAIAKYLLDQLSLETPIYPGEGADTSIDSYRDRRLLNTAALEIVGSGQTCVDLNLTRLAVDDELSPLPDIKFSDIKTDLFVINPSVITEKTRMATMSVCDAIESARSKGSYTSIKVNVPRSKLAAIESLQLGLIGPSEQNILGRTDWADVSIVVPDDNANTVATRLKLELGGEGTVTIGARGIKGGSNASTSQSIRYFSQKS